jgi:hypothetical protein
MIDAGCVTLDFYALGKPTGEFKRKNGAAFLALNPVCPFHPFVFIPYPIMLAIFAFVLTALVFSANVVAQDDGDLTPQQQCAFKCATDSVATSGCTMCVLRPPLPVSNN